MLASHSTEIVTNTPPAPASRYQFQLSTLFRLLAVCAVIFTVGRWLSWPAAMFLMILTSVFAVRPEPRFFTRPAYRIATVGVALALVYFVPLLGPLLLLPITCAFVLARGRFVTLGVIVALSPVGISSEQGVADYLHGTARLRHSGLPGTEFFNLDRQLRCGRTTYGCIVSGDEWLTQVPYNSAVGYLTATLGPMPGAYTGPYPTQDEAISALQQGTDIEIAQLVDDRVRIHDVEVSLDAGVGSGLLKTPAVHTALHYTASPLPITATIWQTQCLILNIPVGLSSSSTDAMIVLIDRHRGRPFAYYGKGEYHHHFPPVSWRPEGH